MNDTEWTPERAQAADQARAEADRAARAKVTQAITLLREAQSEAPAWGAVYYACARSIEDLTKYAGQEGK